VLSRFGTDKLPDRLPNDKLPDKLPDRLPNDKLPNRLPDDAHTYAHAYAHADDKLPDRLSDVLADAHAYAHAYAHADDKLPDRLSNVLADAPRVRHGAEPMRCDERRVRPGGRCDDSGDVYVLVQARIHVHSRRRRVPHVRSHHKRADDGSNALPHALPHQAPNDGDVQRDAGDRVRCDARSLLS
jgi:hypothetical protein